MGVTAHGSIQRTSVARPGVRLGAGRARPDYTTVVIAALPFVIAAGSVASGLAGYRAWFSDEDGPAENLQFVFLVAATIGAALVSRARARRGDRFLAVAYAGLALACFFVAGEEISWGQRLFGIETPPVIAEHNIQHEITLHNTYLFTPIFYLAQLLVGVGLTIAPFLPWSRIVPARWDELRRALIPRPALAAYFAMTGAWRIYRYAFYRPDTPAWVGELSEIPELILYLGVLLFVVEQLRAVPRTRDV
jgi:hypothetical protein